MPKLLVVFEDFRYEKYNWFYNGDTECSGNTNV